MFNKRLIEHFNVDWLHVEDISMADVQIAIREWQRLSEYMQEKAGRGPLVTPGNEDLYRREDDE